MRNKLPENGQDITRIIKSFLKYEGPEFKSEVRHFSLQATKHISLNTTAGCLNPKHFLGRLFIRLIAKCILSSVTRLKSVPLGTYCLRSPLLFSFAPRSQELYG